MSTVDSTTVGFVSERLHRITDTLQRYVDEGKIAGAVALIARRNQIAYFECAGMMDIGAQSYPGINRRRSLCLVSLPSPSWEPRWLMLAIYESRPIECAI